MIKTALSASLIALAVLAPVASAAEQKVPPQKEQKAPVLDAKTAKYCAELAADQARQEGRRHAHEGAARVPVDVRLPGRAAGGLPRRGQAGEARQDRQGVRRRRAATAAKAQWPEWLKQTYRPECSLEKPAKTTPEPEAPFDPRTIGSDKPQV